MPRSKNDILGSLENAIRTNTEVDETWKVLMLEVLIDIRDSLASLDEAINNWANPDA